MAPPGTYLKIIHKRPVYKFFMPAIFYFLKSCKILINDPVGFFSLDTCDLIFEYSIGVRRIDDKNPFNPPANNK